MVCIGWALARPAAAQAEYVVTDLGHLGGGVSHAYGINAAGQVVGYAFTADGDRHAFLWNGVMHDLGTLGGDRSEASGINDVGQVVGESYTADGEIHSFLWDGVMYDLNPLYGASGINDVGQVVGYAYPPGGYYFHAFLWDGAMYDLGTPGGDWSKATGINAVGQVVGYGLNAKGLAHAFLWAGAMYDLGTLGGFTSEAWGINAVGQVVGDAYPADGDYHAFLWDAAQGMRDLNDLIPPDSGWELRSATAINEAGWIVGWGRNADGDYHAFLATPGRIVGTVTDASRRPLKKVKVKAYNSAGERVWKAKTEADGTYLVPASVDTYRLKFKKKGYRGITVRNVGVTAGEDIVVDVALRKR
jgi:probable HAF family extracellular repeat protein